MMEYRVLSRAEIEKLVQMDRTESIEHVFYVREGELRLEKEHWNVKDWSSAEKQKRIATLQQRYDCGATIFGAFDDSRLVGMSVLDHRPLCSGVDRLNLNGMWVSHKYRGKGIGKTLFRLAEQKARELGAGAMYVSATPSENTIRFYMAMGCRPAKPIDPDLFKREPEDIHLELVL